MFKAFEVSSKSTDSAIEAVLEKNFQKYQLKNRQCATCTLAESPFPSGIGPGESESVQSENFSDGSKFPLNYEVKWIRNQG